MVGSALLLSCGRPAEWSGMVYPDRGNLEHPEFVGNFTTFEQCQAATIDKLRQFRDPDAGDYVCGLKCKIDEDFGGLMVCKETRK